MNIQVFRLKASTASFQNALQNQASSPVLQSLEEDRKFNRGFEFVLENILNGKFGEEVIDGLVNPRFNGGDLQSKSGGDARSIDRKRLNLSALPELRNLNLSPNDAEILKNFFQTKFNNQQFAQAAKLNLNAISFGLKNILNGKFDKDVIDSLVNPRFNGGDLQSKSGGDARSIDGKSLNLSALPELRNLNLSPNDAEILKNFFQTKFNNQQFAQAAKLNLNAINFGLKNILNGKFGKDVIDSLVNPRFNGGDLQSKSGGDARSIDGKSLSLPVLPELRNLNLNPNDAEILKTIQKFCSKPEFPDEYKKNFSEFLSSGDTNILKNFKSSLASQEVREETQELIQVIDKLVKSTEVLNLKKEIYTGIADNRDTNELRKLVNNYEAEGPDDIDLKRELLKAIVGKDAQDIIVKTVEILDAGNPNLAIDASAPLLEINLEAAQSLRKLAYRLELSDYRTELEKRLIEDLNNRSLDFSTSNEFLKNSRLRPAIGELNYIESIQEIQEKTKALIQDLIPIRVRQQATELRENFDKKPPTEVLQAIGDLGAQGPAISAELSELYTIYAAANLPAVFQSLFLPQIQEAKAIELQSKFTRTELGGNLEAFKYMQNNFVEVVLPLVESLRANPKTSKEIGVYLENDRNGVRGKTPFEQRLSQLKKQRDLSKIEENYLRSVERLSLFNPYLVACAAVKPEITSEYLKMHFKKLSNSSKAQIQEGSYVPLIQIGTGPNGLSGIGEIVRNNPDLANSMLVIDSGKQPGGPFAVPNGAAWALNSANARGASVRVLPGESEMPEELTVRGFGSPIRWYPGERREGSNIRKGSINPTVDFLPVPDEISSKRYATNQELQLVLAMQAALLVKNLALETEIIKIEPNQHKDLQGDKIVTLRIKEEGNSSREVKIRTDAIFCSSGLGEPTYGFPIDDTKQAQQILQEQRDDEFPKLSTTLEAFKALADIENPRKIKGNTVVIYGGGNSADTLLEYFGNLFNGSNDSVNKIEKIYVLLPGELSSRPRYAQIRDLTARNGNSNLIEFINAKVGDVAYASGDDKSSNRLILLDKEGNSIKDKSSREIVSDYVIAATGFKSGLDKVLEDYAEKIPGSNESELRKKLGLPTNPNITVAETLSRDPNILIVGTASSSNFNLEKLGQLPRLPREALVRNGAENAVAIGFRGPDTQAAVSIWLNERDITLAENTEKSSLRTEINLSSYPTTSMSTGPIFVDISNLEEIKIPNNIPDTSLLLEPIFYSNFGNRVELIDDDRRFRGKLNFTLSYQKAEQNLILSFNDSKGGLIKAKTGIPEASLPEELIRVVINSLAEPDFQKYALTELNNKRGDNPSLSFSLNFKNGYLDPAKSFIEA
jgi:hypothetical protein